MDRTKKSPLSTRVGIGLQTSIWFKISEIVFVFACAFGFMQLMSPLADGDPILTQVVVWFANILMLTLVWFGLKLRGEKLQHFGLTFRPISWRGVLKVFLLSILIFILAVAGFIIGSIVMANITGVPESADMSGYAYLNNNIGMFLLTLIGSYIVASFGEEVIYRAFLINRFLELGVDSKKGRIISVILSSIVFGLAHYQWGAMGMVQTTFMGLALGICYLKLKKRIWILILAHAYMDTFLMVQLYLASN
jgi:membrane protease YdiL (CAAX protease family)